MGYCNSPFILFCTWLTSFSRYMIYVHRTAPHEPLWIFFARDCNLFNMYITIP
jgi:hypothetical protein